ncbi:hypothetical protein EDD18DRAFT_1112178 [Armillaria luteobubalina]|uniref:Uncharacterized protein n=1 Tax=Armillaria luteobubalina TaxID=153913 RepID=A0AA39PH45_9AGAR|nr:hypothetical protein EDD18DRAFT_1112178 [Armillaria luteobubalina]
MAKGTIIYFNVLPGEKASFLVKRMRGQRSPLAAPISIEYATNWPPHLDSFRDNHALTDLYDHNWVLIAPGYINLRPEKEYIPIWHYWDAMTKMWLGLDHMACLIWSYQKVSLCYYLE